jgi:hypothetical protein
LQVSFAQMFYTQSDIFSFADAECGGITARTADTAKIDQ